MRLANKVAIVTGAGSGFGEGIAKTFAQQGARVIVADMNATGGQRVVNEIAAHSQNASARSMGLLGAAERLATVGGSIESRPEGSRWITRITVPLGATR